TLTITATIAGDSREDRIVRRGKSDFQILAHFAERPAAGVAAHFGGRATELAAEGVGEMAVAGKSEFEGECSEVVGAIGQSFERGAEPKQGEVTVDRHAGSLLKDAGEVKGRRVHGAGDLVECDTFAKSAGEPGFGRLGALGVIGLSALSAALARHPVSRER